ncbi:MFS transporter [Rhodococcus cerastii]|nr:MFS transporter [Rhodococcus cerastii]
MFAIATLLQFGRFPSAPHLVAVAAFLSGSASGMGATLWILTIVNTLGSQKIAIMGVSQSGVGAAVGIVVTIISSVFLTSRQGALADIELLWIGAFLMTVASITSAFLFPRISIDTSDDSSHPSGLIKSTKRIFRETWAKHYIIASAALASVILATNFFSIYAASNDKVDGDSLDLILLFANLGLFLGVPLWFWVFSALGGRRMILYSTALVVGAGLICLFTQVSNSWPTLSALGVIIFMSTLGGQAVNPGLQHWATSSVSKVDAEILSTLQGFSGANLAVTGFILSTLGQTGGHIWPMAILLSVNIFALAYIKVYGYRK